MPFFPQAYLSPEPTLFQILSAIDSHSPPKSPATCGSSRRRTSPQSFTPRFDVTETSDAYELYGEVPGLENDGLTIEFSDAQTLLIQGKTERRAAAQQQEGVASATEENTTNTVEEGSDAAEKSHAPTVEDDYDEADTPLVTPASTSTLTAEEKGKQPASASATQDNSVRPRYWVAERRVGEFARSFTFEQRVEADFVTAGLKNGILHVVVPKSLKSRKVVVSVN